jgi:hypothetical protein
LMRPADVAVAWVSLRLGRQRAGGTIVAGKGLRPLLHRSGTPDKEVRHVKKLIVLGIGSVGTAAAAMAFFGTGVAAADDYAGQTYADASSAASDAGQTVLIAVRRS